MARKAGQGKEEEEARARQQEEKTPVREERRRQTAMKTRCRSYPLSRHSLQKVIKIDGKNIPSLAPVTGSALTQESWKIYVAANISGFKITHHHEDKA
ncbi:hypothetical protein STEG23_011059, partial [Scotinomys teguina]